MEYIIFREEAKRPLTHKEIDTNFKYVANEWSYDREYLTGMIVYHSLVAGSYVFYRAKTTTTLGIFDLQEWTSISGASINVVTSTEISLSDYIINEWTDEAIEIGDYLVLTNEDSVYLLYQNDGSHESDYIKLNEQVNTDFLKAVESTEASLIDYISNEWVSGYLNIGDMVILDGGGIWALTSGVGNSVGNYEIISSSSVNWGDVVGTPNSLPSAIDSAVSTSHDQNADTLLDSGNANEVSALEIRTHLDNTDTHFLMSAISIDHDLNITNNGTYTHLLIDAHIDDATIHYTQVEIDHQVIIGSGTYTHAQIDTHLSTAGLTHAEIDAHVSNGFYYHYQIDTHIDDSSIHFLETSINHANLVNVGVYTHPQIDAHMDDPNIHLGVTSISHTTLDDIGTYDHADIDSHIDDATIHFTQNQIDHTVLNNIGVYSHTAIDSHIDDIDYHFLQSAIDHDNLTNSGVNTHNDLDLHVNNSNIHFLVSEINHTNISGIGFYDHYEIDTHVDDDSIHFTEIEINHNNILNNGSYTHGDIDTHIDDTDLHRDVSAISHTELLDIGTNTHGQIDNHITSVESHMVDATIHFLQSEIDHVNLLNIGAYTHAQIDLHIDDLNIHYQQSEILHDNLNGASGFYTHYEIDTHLDDISIHFTEVEINHDNIINAGVFDHDTIDIHLNSTSLHLLPAEINHVELFNVGVNSHTTIDSHIDDVDIHFTMNDILLSSIIAEGYGDNSGMMLNANYVDGDNSIVLCSNNTIHSENSAILAGENHLIPLGLDNVAIIGGSNITADLSDCVYVPKLVIPDGGYLKSGAFEIMHWYKETTDDNLGEAFLTSGARYSIDNNEQVFFRLDVNIYNNTDNVGKALEVRGVIKSDNLGNVAFVGNAISTFTISEDGVYDSSYTTGNWMITVIPNDLNNSLQIQVKGETSKTIRWQITGYMTTNKF